MSGFLVDTAVFVYASGRPHSYQKPCRAVVEGLGRDGVEGEVSVDLVHEFIYVRLKRKHDLAETILAARGIINVCTVHAFELRDLSLALQLFAAHPRLDFRDAIFAATAINRGIDTIISTDRDFDEVPQLKRVDPADGSAVMELFG